MNWASVSFDWNQVRAFLVTVEEGSLSAAARALGLTQPTLSRQVAALEEELGVTLFERIGKTLVVTPFGLELLEHVRAMGQAAGRISLAASGQSQAIDGLVRITASDVLSAHYLPAALRSLRPKAPNLRIEIVADATIRDLQRREADIAIRHVRPEQTDLFARLVQEGRADLYAAPSYLQGTVRPKTLEDLSAHRFISFGDDATIIGALRQHGVSLTEDNFYARSRSGLVVWEMARQGMGITLMSQTLARQSPEMERILPELFNITYPVWLTTHRELQTSRRIRLVFDHLAAYFADHRI